MRCLVINAHSSEKKVKTFHEFVAILRPILMHYDKKAKVIIRKFNAISDFVYAADLCPQPGDEKEGEMDEANRKMALKHFDSLDMIFVDGDEALLPWLPELSDLFGLLRLAYQCGKCVFTTTCGASMLAYINALGGERLHVVNGIGQRLEDIRATDTADPMLKQLFEEADEDGGGCLDREELVVLMKKLYTKRGLARSMKDIREELEEALEEYDDGDGEIEFKEFQEMVGEMRSFKEAGIANSLETSHFVECSTGDVYKFKVVGQQEQFVPYGNVGMRRKVMQGAKVKASAPFSRFLGELEVKINMKYRPHYLFTGLEKNSFKTFVEHSWDLHADGKPTGNGLMHLCTSSHGDMVLECGNIVAVRFPISKRYPGTITLMDSFVKQMHEKMVSDEHLDLCSVLAYQDDTHPLQLKAKPGLKLSSRLRPSTAPASGRTPPPGVPKQKWTKEVTDAVRAVGIVSGDHSAKFKAAAEQPAMALNDKEKQVRLVKEAREEAAMERRAASSQRLSSATSRGSCGMSATSRPAHSATSRKTAKSAPVEMLSDPLKGRVEVRPTSFRPMSAARRQKEAAAAVPPRLRPISAVSGITDVTDVTEATEGYDAITVDDSDSVYGNSLAGASSARDGESLLSHPASHLTSGKRTQVSGVRMVNVKSKRPFSSYKRMMQAQRSTAGTRHISVTNSGVYQSQHELDQLDYKESKKKWVSRKDMDTSLTHARLKPSHAFCGRKMSGWDDVPPFVQAHAGPWKEGNYAATYKFREQERLGDEQAPFYTTVHCEDTSYKEMTNQWQEQDARETEEHGVWDSMSNASQVLPSVVA